MTFAAGIGDLPSAILETHQSAIRQSATHESEYPSALADAIGQLDRLLGCVRGPVCVLVVGRSGNMVFSGDRRHEQQSSRLHTLIEPQPASGDVDGEPLAVLALAPLQSPAEGEQLARLWHVRGAETVGVATSLRSDDGDSLLAAALSAFVQAREFNINGVIICPDDERSWTLKTNSPTGA